MFDYQGPVQAHQAQRIFMEDYASVLPEVQKDQMRAANAEITPVPALLGGMEVLFVLAVEVPLATAPGRAAVLQTLGLSATAVGTGQYGGAEKRDRAWAIAAWAAHKIEPTDPAPAQPDVDPAYTTIVPAEPAPIAPA